MYGISDIACPHEGYCMAAFVRLSFQFAMSSFDMMPSFLMMFSYVTFISSIMAYMFSSVPHTYLIYSSIVFILSVFAVSSGLSCNISVMFSVSRPISVACLNVAFPVFASRIPMV